MKKLGAQELCESGGGRPGHPVPNSLNGLCGCNVEDVPVKQVIKGDSWFCCFPQAIRNLQRNSEPPVVYTVNRLIAKLINFQG